MGARGDTKLKITEDRDGARITHEFEEMTPEKRPQDPGRDGRGLTFETLEHGGEYPDTMPQAIKLTDAKGRSCTYIPTEELMPQQRILGATAATCDSRRWNTAGRTQTTCRRRSKQPTAKGGTAP